MIDDSCFLLAAVQYIARYYCCIQQQYCCLMLASFLISVYYMLNKVLILIRPLEEHVGKTKQSYNVTHPISHLINFGSSTCSYN